ncbi:hypothetical protein H1P_1530014 [Hyella patelloides LEGE 07179]|uniref:Uncharacterized protein n=1 Tax=Hyella patelloides LEGE 07179 TaxID=945734 RepID=A0A563VMB8_9CYAN|nr:hypothetical protein H1P_1530014 [Hyella patelloides LEGE 07179]
MYSIKISKQVATTITRNFINEERYILLVAIQAYSKQANGKRANFQKFP